MKTCPQKHRRGGAVTRPPKNVVFRFTRREKTIFSPCGDGFCFGKIHGRVNAPPLQDYGNILYPISDIFYLLKT